MKALVTGASGFIGYHIAQELKAEGIDVRVLVRKESPLTYLTPLGVEFAIGDLQDYDSVLKAMEGCRVVFHAGADYRLWVENPANMYKTNVEGTENVMKCAHALQVEKVIYTSTVGVLKYSSDATPYDETALGTIDDMVGHYKRSKFMAGQKVQEFIAKELPVVIVYPTTPIGPVDIKPTPTGKIIVDFLNGKMPAYLDTGLNFVHVRDVAKGHILALKHGITGQGYILGNKNLHLKDFLESLAAITNTKPPKIRLPYLPVLMAAYVNEAISSWITHKPPLIPLTGVKMARKFMFFDCTKAITELNMPQTPVEVAIKEAVDWFRQNVKDRDKDKNKDNWNTVLV
ncbi:MAG: NAD-dependent epimerase/dehydratase family protein [Candidatus Magnetoovum sp. WYHC-5]|nr:NAD-dependent epimerase/dehydratase family protein [Candidatus Magnetoovum sp. WYHC-5]